MCTGIERYNHYLHAEVNSERCKNFKYNFYKLYNFRQYWIDADGFPINPVWPTGVRGRGKLARWGPNFAVGAIVYREYEGHLQFIGVMRRDPTHGSNFYFI